MLEKHVKYFFTVCDGWASATCKWNKQFPRGAYKRGDLKNISKVTGKHKKQSSGGISV